MFQKCSLIEIILQLLKAIALIMTVLILQRRLSIHLVQCSITFQNSVNWLIKIQSIVLWQRFQNNPSPFIKAMFNLTFSLSSYLKTFSFWKYLNSLSIYEKLGKLKGLVPFSSMEPYKTLLCGQYQYCSSKAS